MLQYAHTYTNTCKDIYNWTKYTTQYLPLLHAMHSFSFLSYPITRLDKLKKSSEGRIDGTFWLIGYDRWRRSTDRDDSLTSNLGISFMWLLLPALDDKDKG